MNRGGVEQLAALLASYPVDFAEALADVLRSGGGRILHVPRGPALEDVPPSADMLAIAELGDVACRKLMAVTEEQRGPWWYRALKGASDLKRACLTVRRRPAPPVEGGR